MISLLGIICLVWLFAEGLDPVQNIKKYFKVDNYAEYINSFQWFFVKLLNCCLCLGFWTGLVLSQDVFIASITSVGAEILSRIFKKL